MKQVALRIRDGDLVQNRSVLGHVSLNRLGCCRKRTYGSDKESGNERTGRLHRRFAPTGCGADSLNFFSSFSHKPSKLPLDMINSKSPGLASAARWSAILSAPSNALASLPSART